MPWLVFSIIANHAVDAILDFCRDTLFSVAIQSIASKNPYSRRNKYNLRKYLDRLIPCFLSPGVIFRKRVCR